MREFARVRPHVSCQTAPHSGLQCLRRAEAFIIAAEPTREFTPSMAMELRAVRVRWRRNSLSQVFFLLHVNGQSRRCGKTMLRVSGNASASRHPRNHFHPHLRLVTRCSFSLSLSNKSSQTELTIFIPLISKSLRFLSD